MAGNVGQHFEILVFSLKGSIVSVSVSWMPVTEPITLTLLIEFGSRPFQLKIVPVASSVQW